MFDSNTNVRVVNVIGAALRARRIRALVCGSIGSLALAVAGAAPTSLSASQIVEKNIAARGGLSAWRAVQTMQWAGRMDAGTGDSTSRSARFAQDAMAPKSRRAIAKAAGADKAEPVKQVQLPFVVDMKRPTSSRVEIEFAGKTAVQVYDGKNGWKLRPFLNRNDVEPFTQEEMQASAGKWHLDGPLFDYSAKGSKVDLEGVEAVDGRDAYRLKVTTSAGLVQHVWIDAQNFLDVKVEGAPRRMDGKLRTVWVYQRDFRAEHGVMVPRLLETVVDGYPDSHRMVIEKVAVNPALADSLFAKPSGA